MFQEEIRPQDRLIDDSNLKGVFGSKRAERERHSLRTKTLNGGSIRCPERRNFSGVGTLDVRGWEDRNVCSTVDEVQTAADIVDNGERA